MRHSFYFFAFVLSLVLTANAEAGRSIRIPGVTVSNFGVGSTLYLMVSNSFYLRNVGQTPQTVTITTGVRNWSMQLNFAGPQGNFPQPPWVTFGGTMFRYTNPTPAPQTVTMGVAANSDAEMGFGYYCFLYPIPKCGNGQAPVENFQPANYQTAGVTATTGVTYAEISVAEDRGAVIATYVARVDMLGAATPHGSNEINLLVNGGRPF